MRRYLTLFVAGTLFFHVLGPALKCVAAQEQPAVAELFNELQSGPTSGQAEIQLRKIGTSDTGARRYLARHLPAVIDADPRDSRPEYRTVMRVEWYNAVQLAASLRIAQAAPALAKWISFREHPQLNDASVEDCPAAAALVQVGDSAVPALQNLLYRGDRDQLSLAVNVLLAIGSPKAKSALRQYAATGPDRDLADIITRKMRQ
jgi:hypothetical protein